MHGGVASFLGKLCICYQQSDETICNFMAQQVYGQQKYLLKYYVNQIKGYELA